MDMANTQKGRASLLYEEPPLVLGAASIVGEKEGNGPIGSCFDKIEMDPLLGKKNWRRQKVSYYAGQQSWLLKRAGLKERRSGIFLAVIFRHSFPPHPLDVRS